MESSPIADRQPWMTFEAIKWLTKYLPHGARVFEYGSGGSTLFFLDRGAKLVSIEHDPQWHSTLSSILSEENLLSKCEYRFEPPTILEFGSPAFPSIRFGDARADFCRYANSVHDFSDGTFDLISIDGRARVHCAKNSIPKVKEGGYLVLDNSERDDYNEVTELLADWRRFEFYGVVPYVVGLSQTTIWQAPSKSSIKAST